jgi:PadR family transcriptional regulator, regulatory protein PadR
VTSKHEELLEQWEQNYKRGLLSFWILLALSEREMYAYEMGNEIRLLSQETIVADDNSIYRALKRFADSGLVCSEQRPSEVGPPRRYFLLSDLGQTLLKQFITRNLTVFQAPRVVKAMEHAVA